MRWILVGCALLTVLALPAATGARTSAPAKPGYVVLQNATGNGGVNGSPVVTLVVRGFVLGRIAKEGSVDVIQLPSVNGQGAPQVNPPVSTRTIHWHGLTGKEYSGSNFRFRAIGGFYRVVVRGSGVNLFAGGGGRDQFVIVRGSSVYKNKDGRFSINGSRLRSLPTRPLTRKLGG
jgi:hypothetical protein